MKLPLLFSHNTDLHVSVLETVLEASLSPFLLQGSRPVLRLVTPASLKPCGMFCRGWWGVHGLCFAFGLLVWKSMQGMAFLLRQCWQRSQGLSVPPALEIDSLYQVDVCPAIICLRNFMKYHITCYQRAPPSSLLYLHFTEGKLRPRKIK